MSTSSSSLTTSSSSSSSMSSSSSTMTSSSFSYVFNVNISDFMTEKLDMSNYLTWSYLFHPVLDIYDLNDHISASPNSPPQSLSGNDVGDSNANPEYLFWRKIDRLILSWINAIVKHEVLPLLHHSTTAFEAWMALSNHFLDKSTAREVQLKLALDQLRKNDLSINVYCQKFKEIIDALTTIGQPLTEREKVQLLLRGSPLSYESLITVVSNQKPPPSLAELCTMLLSYEARLEHIDSLSSAASTQPQTALVSLAASQSGRGFTSTHGRGGRWCGGNRAGYRGG